jgi:hypothetical protein
MTQQPEEDTKQLYTEYDLECAEREATELYYYVRASQGLMPKEDQFSGLMNISDVRERTRLKPRHVLIHSYLRLLAEIGGDEFEICKQLADQLDVYHISEGGEQRKEAILLQSRRQEMTIQPLAVPQVITTPEKPKKRHFWSHTE